MLIGLFDHQKRDSISLRRCNEVSNRGLSGRKALINRQSTCISEQLIASKQWVGEVRPHSRPDLSATIDPVALIMSRLPKDMRVPAAAMISELRKAAEEVRDQIDCC